MKELKPGAGRSLMLSTTTFAISFATWCSIAALAPTFTHAYNLSAKASSLLIALPVLVGAVGRIPAGMLADRFGGRRVFSALMILSAVAAVGVGLSKSYGQLLGWSVFLGLAGTSFAIGVSFTSRWFTNDQQGTALGLFGLGNIGQSIAMFGAPVIALWLGSWRPVFFILALVSAIWGLAFYLFARDAVSTVTSKTVSENLLFLCHSRTAQSLSLFYFLTFGGFIAIAIYLPTLLEDLFNLSPADAGARTAFFVLLAIIARPIGGMLADRYVGERVLTAVFGSIAVLAVLLAFPLMSTFTVGALGTAIALGLGNGAIFKLVPHNFPGELGTVTGLVGAFGLLGGFFPPLVLGLVRDATGSYVLGFVMLAMAAVICLLVNNLMFGRKSRVAGPVISSHTQPAQ